MKMKQRMLPAAMIAALSLSAAPAVAQEYWDYDPWENEWERHDPVQGLEYEYDNGVDVEEEAYEWEAGEGYHEEEWYDPSDWFDSDDSVDYESDYTYGYDYNDSDTYGYDDYWYDDYDYDYDYGYDSYDDFDYAYSYDDSDVEYDFAQEVKGEVVGFQRIGGSNGQPQSVRMRLRDEDGQMHTLHLGDLVYFQRNVPRLQKGDRVVIGGQNLNLQGRKVFKAEEMTTASGSYKIPDYEYERRIAGRLAGLRRVQLQRDGGTVEAVVAKVEPWQGKTMDVLIGDVEDLQRQGRSLRRGTRIQVDGYRRIVDGQSTFVVQDLQVLSGDEQQQQQVQAQQMQRSQGQRQGQGQRQAQRNRAQRDDRQRQAQRNQPQRNQSQRNQSQRQAQRDAGGNAQNRAQR